MHATYALYILIIYTPSDVASPWRRRARALGSLAPCRAASRTPCPPCPSAAAPGRSRSPPASARGPRSLRKRAARPSC